MQEASNTKQEMYGVIIIMSVKGKKNKQKKIIEEIEKSVQVGNSKGTSQAASWCPKTR